MSITLGWWLIPLLITVVSFAWATYKCSGYMGGFLDISPIIFYPMAIIISLVAWLVWSIF